MTTRADILVSAIAVVRDHAAIVPAFVRETAEVLRRHYANSEVLLIDNGSADGTEHVVRRLLGEIPCVRYLRLTRPADDETALLAGLDAAIGDYVVTLDPDLDSPDELVSVVERCRLGFDLVQGVERVPPRQSLVYRVLRRCFITLASRLMRLDLPTGTTALRAISRQGVNALVRVRLRRRFFGVVVADVGLNTAVHHYDRISRSGGRPRRSLGRSLRVGMSVLVHNSIAPLRLASVLGLSGSALSLFYSVYVFAVYLLKPDVMPGWTTLSLAVSGLFGLAFLMLALIGEYLGRLLEESTSRPLYHVREELSSAVMLSELTRLNVLEAADDRITSEPLGTS